MYRRNTDFYTKIRQSYFLFGPRGVGKTTWLRTTFPDSAYIDLLDFDIYRAVSSNPKNISQFILKHHIPPIIIDEVQKVPEVLNEIHRLIEEKKYRFILTGSNSRSLRKKGVNLLAGRALTKYMHPLTAAELGDDFSLSKSLWFGQLPMVYTTAEPAEYLKSYIQTYLKEEILQEGLTRNLRVFTSFLEAASFSQGSLLNCSEISRELAIDRKTVIGYFDILEDLLIGCRLKIFNRKSKRRLITHNKFYFFDAGVYRAIRPSGPLDNSSEISGISLETLVFQELRAAIDYYAFKYELFFWRTSNGLEVDFILYGEAGFIAIEVKSTRNIQPKDLHSLKAFKNDYPGAQCFLFYGGDLEKNIEDIHIIPVEKGIKKLPELLGGID